MSHAATVTVTTLAGAVHQAHAATPAFIEPVIAELLRYAHFMDPDSLLIAVRVHTRGVSGGTVIDAATRTEDGWAEELATRLAHGLAKNAPKAR